MASTTVKLNRTDTMGHRTVGQFRTATQRRYVIVRRIVGSPNAAAARDATGEPYAGGYSDNAQTALIRARRMGNGAFVIDLNRTRETGIAYELIDGVGRTQYANEHREVRA